MEHQIKTIVKVNIAVAEGCHYHDTVRAVKIL